LYEFLARTPNRPKSRQAGRVAGNLAFAAHGKARRPVVGMQLKIGAQCQTSTNVEGGLVQAGLVFCALLRAGKDQRPGSLVDQDAVGLVHNSKMQAAEKERLSAGKSVLE